MGKAEVIKTPGVVDEAGILWKSTSVGKLLYPPADQNTCWSCVSAACAKYEACDAVGERAVVRKEIVNGFEKFEMGDFSFTTYGDYFKRIEALGSGLAKLSELEAGSRVIIYADTQMLWLLSANAAWRQGLVVGTIYATLGEEGATFGINQSDCKVVFADGKLLKVLGNIADQICCKRVIVFKEEDVDGASADKLKAAGIEVTPLVELEKSGKDDPQPATPSQTKDDAVLMYTSGTTGNPKGVRLSHENITALVAATLSPTSALYQFAKPGERYLCYLPLAHIMELAVEISLLARGLTLGYGGVGTILPTSIKMLHPNQLGDAQALQPSLFVAAPAVLDKVYAAVNGKFRLAKGLIKSIIEGGLESGKANFDAGGMGASGCIAPILFRKKVATLLGGKVKLILTGSAPLSADVQKFVQTVFSCPVRQGYGLTETCAGTCVTTPEDNGTGVVGPPQECACIKLRDWEEGNYKNSDAQLEGVGMRRGEVLIGGPMVCEGYLENPKMPDAELAAKNKEEFVTIDGIRYFCTGDIGQYKANGTLQIIDRKKDLVKLQQGEYVALSKVENVMKSSPFTILPMCYAKSTMSYCVALLCPNEAQLKAVSGAPAGADLKALCKDPTVIAAVTKDIQAACKKAKLAKFEIPEKVILIDELWTPDNDMLTAVNKLKRKQIEAKHADQISEVYV